MFLAFFTHSIFFLIGTLSGKFVAGDVCIANNLRYLFIGANDEHDFWIINDTSADVIRRIKKGSLESQRKIDLTNYDSKTIEQRVYSIREERNCGFLHSKLDETGDFEIVVKRDDGSEVAFRVHIAVLLMLDSEFFNVFLFANDSKVLKAKRIVVFEPEVQASIMPLLIKFFYVGEFTERKRFADWSSEELEQLASAADYLQMANLSDWCCKMLNRLHTIDERRRLLEARTAERQRRAVSSSGTNQRR
jgi:hypothetical protein